MNRKHIYCDNCGEDLGEGEVYPGEFNSCGKKECNKEIDHMNREQENRIRWEAEEDDYNRYR